MELMEEIGIAETRDHVLGLHERLFDGLDALGARVVTPREPERRGALLCVASTDAPALVEALDRDGIVTSSRAGSLRISPHAYNSVEDVDGVLEALSRHIAYLL
jgi:selenocysteine lyase/cysteine desulfurase